MDMRALTPAEMQKLIYKKNRETGQMEVKKGVRKIAVENFLGTMGKDKSAAYKNASLDARLYKWPAPTVNAIMKGIELASSQPAAKVKTEKPKRPSCLKCPSYRRDVGRCGLGYANPPTKKGAEQLWATGFPVCPYSPWKRL